MQEGTVPGKRYIGDGKAALRVKKGQIAKWKRFRGPRLGRD